MDKVRFEGLDKKTIEIRSEFIPVHTIIKLGCMDKARFERL